MEFSFSLASREKIVGNDKIHKVFHAGLTNYDAYSRKSASIFRTDFRNGLISGRLAS